MRKLLNYTLWGIKFLAEAAENPAAGFQVKCVTRPPRTAAKFLLCITGGKMAHFVAAISEIVHH
jgi:hypothetical protein